METENSDLRLHRDRLMTLHEQTALAAPAAAARPSFHRLPANAQAHRIRDDRRQHESTRHRKPVTNGEAHHRSREVAALVLVVDPVDRARVDPALVQAALGLTPAQAAVAVLLAEGRTPRQIAAATGRRYSTVRTHLKHIYIRLGVARQLAVAQLVLALSTLPASGK